MTAASEGTTRHRATDQPRAGRPWVDQPTVQQGKVDAIFERLCWTRASDMVIMAQHPRSSTPRSGELRAPHADPEYLTRRKRIAPKPTASGWKIVPFDDATEWTNWTHHAVTEFSTSNGPADYALFLDGRPVA